MKDNSPAEMISVLFILYLVACLTSLLFVFVSHRGGKWYEIIRFHLVWSCHAKFS